VKEGGAWTKEMFIELHAHVVDEQGSRMFITRYDSKCKNWGDTNVRFATGNHETLSFFSFSLK